MCCGNSEGEPGIRGYYAKCRAYLPDSAILFATTSVDCSTNQNNQPVHLRFCIYLLLPLTEAMVRKLKHHEQVISELNVLAFLTFLSACFAKSTLRTTWPSDTE
jgi:hypothetical protein